MFLQAISTSTALIFIGLITVTDSLYFLDSAIFFNSDLYGHKILPLSCVNGCRLYAVAPDAGSAEKNIQFGTLGTDVISLYDLVNSNTAANGEITPLILNGSSYLTNNNPNTTVISPFAIYTTEKEGNNTGTPVYDASVASSLSLFIGNRKSAVTFLTTAPFFTLKNYSISQGAIVRVHSTSYTEKADDYNMLFKSRSSEDAALSFTTVVGPLATVYLDNVGSEQRSSLNVDQSDRRTTDFEVGASFLAISPGYKEFYSPIFNDSVHYEFTTTKDVAIHVTASWMMNDTIGETFTLRTFGKQYDVTQIYHQLTSNLHNPIIANKVTVDFQRKSKLSNFIVFFETTESAGESEQFMMFFTLLTLFVYC